MDTEKQNIIPIRIIKISPNASVSNDLQEIQDELNQFAADPKLSLITEGKYDLDYVGPKTHGNE